MKSLRAAPVFVVAPYAPGTRAGGTGRRLRDFLSLLGKNHDPRIFPVGEFPSDPEVLGAALEKAVAERPPDAVFFIDDGRTRGLVDSLRKRAGTPTILVSMKENGAASAAPRPLPECSPHEAWELYGESRLLRTAGLLPQSFHHRPEPDAAWIARRLRALNARRPTALAPPKRASIIIPCWNNWRYTRECLESVERWTPAPHEVIVIDNGSRDGTGKFLRSLAKKRRLRVLTNASNQGFAKAVNQGMRAARGDAFVWLNNDAVVASGWLERLSACAERGPWIGAVGPLTNECEGIQRLALAGGGPLKPREFRFLAEAVGLKHAGHARLVHRLVGFCLLVKREAVARVGLLDERFGPGCYEDFDYCLRLRQAGYELALAEDVFVYHHGHKSFAGDTARLRQSEANREVLIEKWCRRSLEFLDDLDPAMAASSSL